MKRLDVSIVEYLLTVEGGGLHQFTHEAVCLLVSSCGKSDCGEKAEVECTENADGERDSW